MKKEKDLRYFKLRSECYLVKGPKKGALYNLLTGDIYTLENAEQKILAACEADTPINEIPRITGIDIIKVNEVLMSFESNYLGMFFESPIYVDKYIDRNIWGTKQFFRDPPYIQSATLEISNRCDLDCRFCDNGVKSIRRWGCLGCSKRTEDNHTPLSEKEYSDILFQLKRLDCRSIVIRGGNPLCETNLFKHIVEEAGKLGFPEIVLLTNGVNLDHETIEYFLENGIHPFFQVFSHDENEYERICGKQGSFSKLVDNLSLLKTSDVPFSILTLFSHADTNKIRETMNFFRKFSPANIVRDNILPLSGEHDQDSSIKQTRSVFAYQNREFSRTSVKDFFDKMQYNSCLNGKLTISQNGDVLPCPEMREDIIGNVKSTSLQTLFQNDSFEDYWNLSKQNIPKCKKCQYRFACWDCRAMEKNTTCNLHSMVYCAYDPEKAEWKDLESWEKNDFGQHY